MKNKYSLKLITTLILAYVITACTNSDDPKVIQEVELTAERDGHSVARLWNEVVLDAIRNDYARPTVHARNLFHISSAMYDSWTAYRKTETPLLFGQSLNGYNCNKTDFDVPVDTLPAQEKTISYATFSLLKHRFATSPSAGFTLHQAEELMVELGFDSTFTSIDYQNATDPAAALGNYIANCYIEFGLTDGSNEQNDYANTVYKPVNADIKLNYELAGNPDITDLNRWQRIALENFIDQSGNLVTDIPDF
ncbi:DUF6851 domain-containing protein [Psychrosphaera algicola]|uniref:DUF6851 domain-containing protein n=1 Tax=Psychrosphaera algicola TaxID=3023714 RepID=A0ABT5FDE9_9GAMM|nr:hypothetical protein [Psychrosphaera sp. G1-22]MDC2889542.1 hypothetical protein [Psychrosphaera sp. G1-22]